MLSTEKLKKLKNRKIGRLKKWKIYKNNEEIKINNKNQKKLKTWKIARWKNESYIKTNKSINNKN